MPPRSSSPICERSLDLTLIGIGRRDIPQCSSKHFHMEAFYHTFSGGQRPSQPAAPSPSAATPEPSPASQILSAPAAPRSGTGLLGGTTVNFLRRLLRLQLQQSD